MSRCRHKRVVTHLRQVGSLSTAFLLEIDIVCGGEVCISLKPEPFCTRRKEEEIPSLQVGSCSGFCGVLRTSPGMGWGDYCLKLVMEGLPLRRGRNNGCMVMKDECRHQLGTWEL